MNESTPTLDDLALFLCVAESASLTEAARRSEVPLPTLSRRMTQLERTTGRALFMRGKAGYALSADGRALASELTGLHDLRHRVTRWQRADTGPAPVRITTGFWTARYLAQHLVPDPGALWFPAFVPSNAALDLARRAADIGIRNAVPDHPWLARRRVWQVQQAVYGRDQDVTGFVALPASASLPASQRWVHDHHPNDIRATALDPRLCLDLALAGFGRIVLPCFVGDAEPGLQRLYDPIPELTHDAWLVSHHEARNDPPIRAAISAILAALSKSD